MSTFPRVLAPVRISTDGTATNEDYEFRDEPHFAEDGQARVVMFTRSIGHYLGEMLAKESAKLACEGSDLYVVGSVAWATDKELMSALGQHTSGTCLVVNKESWLSEYTFRALKPISLELMFLSQDIMPPSYSEPWARSVWCAGAINVEKNVQFPRMHRKDLVFCARQRPRGDIVSAPLVPYAVWCGSYNLTRTARDSVESATLTWSTILARHSYRAFLQVLAHAEPIDSKAVASSPVLTNGA